MYDIDTLPEPAHRPAFPLKSVTQYFWNFRARYTLDGQPHLTGWARSNIPSNAPAEYWERPPAGSFDLDAIPATNYFRFSTPG